MCQPHQLWSYEPLNSTIFHEFSLHGWIRVAVYQEHYMLWTWDLHHRIQQRLRFVCGSIVTTTSDLEQWAPELNHYVWIWFTWVNSCCHISWTLQPPYLWTCIQQRWMFINIICGNSVTTPSALELWAPEVNHVSWILFSWLNLCGHNYLLNLTTYGHETCTTGHSNILVYSAYILHSW